MSIDENITRCIHGNGNTDRQSATTEFLASYAHTFFVVEPQQLVRYKILREYYTTRPEIDGAETNRHELFYAHVRR